MRTGWARLGRLALTAACLLAVAGCATPTVTAYVTTFHEWRGEPPLTFSYRRTPEQEQSLEHRAYEQLVSARLEAVGLQPAPAAAARYQVAFEYSSQGNLERWVDYPFPYLYPYPYAGAMRFGYPGFGGFYDPWWWGPPMPIVTDVAVFRYGLRVNLFDTHADGATGGRKVFESSASSLLYRSGLPQVMPALVEAVFADFPGPSGVSRRVTVPLAPTP